MWNSTTLIIFPVSFQMQSDEGQSKGKCGKMLVCVLHAAALTWLKTSVVVAGVVGLYDCDSGSGSGSFIIISAVFLEFSQRPRAWASAIQLCIVAGILFCTLVAIVIRTQQLQLEWQTAMGKNVFIFICRFSSSIPPLSHGPSGFPPAFPSQDSHNSTQVCNFIILI